MRYGKRDTRAAFHEAGHCLISMHEGVNVTRLGIEKKTSWNGQRFILKEGWIRHGRGMTASLENHILIALAGPTAEKMCPFGMGRFRYQSSLPDVRKMWKTLDEIGFSDSGRVRYLKQCQSRVERMLRHHWPEITALANALLERKRLTGMQAYTILKEASGDIE